MSDIGEKLYLATNDGIASILSKLDTIGTDIDNIESSVGGSSSGGNVTINSSITMKDRVIPYTKFYCYAGDYYTSNIVQFKNEYYMLLTQGYSSFTAKIYKYSGGKWVQVCDTKVYYPDYNLLVCGDYIYFTGSSSSGSSRTYYVYRFNGSTVSSVCTKPKQWSRAFVIDGSIYALYYNSNTTYFYKFNNSSTMTQICSGAYYPGSNYYDGKLMEYDGKVYFWDAYASSNANNCGVIVFNKTSMSFVLYSNMLNCPIPSSSRYSAGFVLPPNIIVQNNKAIMFGYLYSSTSSSQYTQCYEIDLTTYEFTSISYVALYISPETGIEFFNGIPCYKSQIGRYSGGADDDYEYELKSYFNTLNYYLPANSEIHYESGFVQKVISDEFASMICDEGGVPAMNYYIRTP